MTLQGLTQFDGGPLAGLNCGTTEGAELVAFATGGLKHPTGSEYRAQVLEPDGDRDVTGGTSPSQIQATAKRAYGVDLDLRNMAIEDALALSDRDDVAVSWAVSYAPVSGTRFDACPGFRGFHAIGRSGGRVYDPLADGRRPGIPDAPEDWPDALLLRASEGYAGAGRAVVLIATRPKPGPAPKPKSYSAAFTAGPFWLFTVAGGVITGRERHTFAKATSAPCDAPAVVRWPGQDSRRLVRIQAGPMKGRYVQPGETHVQLVETK